MLVIKISASILLACLGPSLVRAQGSPAGQEPLRYRQRGRAYGHASAETSYEWDSNIRRRSGPREEDHILTVRPILSGRLEGPRDSVLESTYRLEAQRFLRRPSLNALNHRWDALGRLGTRLGFLEASNL